MQLKVDVDGVSHSHEEITGRGTALTYGLKQQREIPVCWIQTNSDAEADTTATDWLDLVQMRTRDDPTIRRAAPTIRCLSRRPSPGLAQHRSDETLPHW